MFFELRMPGRLIGSPVVGTDWTGVVYYATTRALDVDSLRRKREVRLFLIRILSIRILSRRNECSGGVVALMCHYRRATNARGSGNRRPRLRAFTGKEATVAADGHTCEASSPKGRVPKRGSGLSPVVRD